MTPLELTLIILLCTIVAFLSGRVPFAVISAGIMISLIMTGVMKPAEAFAGFTNTNVVMFVAMFVIGAAITKTSLLDRAQRLVVKYKDRPKMLILIASLVAAFLACLTSATATAAIMIPLLVGICNEIGVSRSKLLYPAMAVANIATAMTFLGQGASNMAWSDVMMKAGAAVPLNIWDFTIARIPILLITFLYMVFFGYRLMPDRDNAGFQDKIQAKDVSAKLSAGKEKLAVLIVLATIVLMLLEKTIGIRMYLTASLGAVLLVLTGILSEKEALASIHQPTVFLFAGVLALSDAIAATGAGDVVAEWMLRLLGNTTNPYFIMAVFFIIPLILTQIMSNLATVTIFIPLVATACVKLGVDPRAAVIGVLTASCTSIMTPMAAPCQIMIMGPGGYSLKDYLKCGTPLVILITAASILIFPIMFPFFG
ncbi:MAG: SLC13 family permease [Oribacterium sp.]